LGDLDFEKAIELFAETIKIGYDCGVDLILIETMNDSYETKAAVLAAKETCDLPILVTNVYNEDGKLLTGADATAMVALLEGLGVDGIGINCSLGPKQMLPVITQLLSVSSLPIIVNPNAGIPQVENGVVKYNVSSDEFAETAYEFVKMGARVVGGCCGTTPEYISRVIEKCSDFNPCEITNKDITVISSYTHAVTFGEVPILIGERINPTGKPKLKSAIVDGDFEYIVNEGLSQRDKSVQVLDVNVGLPGTNESEVMCKAVKQLQTVLDLPLQLDSSDANVLENAMRLYNGKPMINSVNGKKESMEQIFPLVKKYGGVVVGLTLDEEGIPATAEGRLAIAEKIVNTGAVYGVDKKDIIIDPLAMSVSADDKSALITLEAVALIKQHLGVKTSLGVSNISYGLPNRNLINSAFFVMAMQKGLDAAIINPFSVEMMGAYHSYIALSGYDKNFLNYISLADGDKNAAVDVNDSDCTDLKTSIIKGLKESAVKATEKLLLSEQPIRIINEYIIPALDTVGKGFENKTVYLPQLLLSAEVASISFSVIKNSMSSYSNVKVENKIVLATVKGDIHDIGKNIVKTLLQNYGFNVIDLGKDVDPNEILCVVLRENIKLVGLSALMTTTVASMEETVKLLRTNKADCKIMVGGAVLNQDYADKIGADFYGKDAMESVRYAEKVFNI
ncbi:MAG: homocysteine S-methyltransferase family protein, partial [bacterium]|nr:homocysteine S-methyltransferase family protein [bacterium]